jgi:chlorite dismutase
VTSSRNPVQEAPQPAAQDQTPVARQFVNYAFYKADLAWRRLTNAEKEKGREEFLGVVEKYRKDLMILPYSTVGLKGETDFLLWRIGYELEKIRDMSAELNQTGLGKYLHNTYSYLAMTKHSTYVDKHEHPGQEGRRLRIVPGNAKYFFLYPFWKTHEWYQLPKEERQKMMDVHIAIGHKYPGIKINTSYAFGLDDPDFVVAFEGNSPADFLDLVMELREVKSRLYTLRDTPIFTCIKQDLKEILASL